MTSTALLPAAGPATPPQRSRRVITGAVASLVIAVFVAAAWALYAELNHAIGGRALAWSLLFAFVPVLPLTALFLWLDRLRPEPAWLLAVTFGYGGLVATYASLQLNGWLAGLVGDRTGATPRSAVFVAPWVEEAAKALVIFLVVVWRRYDFNAVVAGVVYGGLAGVSFAFTENLLYYGQLFQRTLDSGEGAVAALDAVQRLFLFRGLGAPFVHPMFTLLTGLGIGLAVRHHHVGVRILAPVAGYCGAVLLHMGYNTIASFADQDGLLAVYLTLLIPTLAALVAAVVLARRHQHRVIEARLRDYASFGWLKPEHVPYIVSARARRRARRHIKPYGAVERRRLRAFQRTGLELAILRDRMVRGVAGTAALPREQQLVAQLRDLRGRVILPEVAPEPTRLSSATSSW